MCQIHVFELHRYRRSQGSSTFYAWIFRTFLAYKHLSNAKTSGIIHLDVTSCTVKRMMQNNTNKIKETIRSRKTTEARPIAFSTWSKGVKELKIYSAVKKHEENQVL